MKDMGMKTERKGTGKSALGLVIIAVLIVALVAVVAWAFSQPGFLEEAVNILAIVVVALVIIAVIAYIAYAFIAVVMYATKGEVVQTGVDHSIDDVVGVEGKMLDDDGNDKH
ncbi:hypothetical protein [Candidatus Methanoprimaticola sp. MG2]|uniref:hypothetical protein n=1 Tax=Candidatus Methanoprimaticola sp. MG2 TaxID=3228838 RepID=UPI0039C630E1